jgi:hypothetical protein
VPGGPSPLLPQALTKTDTNIPNKEHLIRAPIVIPPPNDVQAARNSPEPEHARPPRINLTFIPLTATPAGNPAGPPMNPTLVPPSGQRRRSMRPGRYLEDFAKLPAAPPRLDQY